MIIIKGMGEALGGDGCVFGFYAGDVLTSIHLSSKKLQFYVKSVRQPLMLKAEVLWIEQFHMWQSSQACASEFGREVDSCPHAAILLAESLWVSDLMSLSVSFLICKMDAVDPPQEWWKVKGAITCTWLSLVPSLWMVIKVEWETPKKTAGRVELLQGNKSPPRPHIHSDAWRSSRYRINIISENPRRPPTHSDWWMSPQQPTLTVFLAACVCVCVQSCPALCDPMDCIPLGSCVQERILKWVAMPSSRGSSQPREQTHISCAFCVGGCILYRCAIGSGIF